MVVVSGFKIVGPNHEPLVQGKQDERRYTVGSKHCLDGEAIPCQHGFHFSRCAIATLRFIVPPPGFRLMRVVAHEPVIDCGDGKYVTLVLDVVGEVADPGPMLTGTVSTIDETRTYRNGYLHQDDDAHPALVVRSPSVARDWYQNGRPGRCDGDDALPHRIEEYGDETIYLWADANENLHRSDGRPGRIRFVDGRAMSLQWYKHGEPSVDHDHKIAELHRWPDRNFVRITCQCSCGRAHAFKKVAAADDAEIYAHYVALLDSYNLVATPGLE
jgi:hypothetical protein